MTTRTPRADPGKVANRLGIKCPWCNQCNWKGNVCVAPKCNTYTNDGFTKVTPKVDIHCSPIPGCALLKIELVIYDYMAYWDVGYEIGKRNTPYRWELMYIGKKLFLCDVPEIKEPEFD